MTGDKMETAINVGYSSGLVKNEEELCIKESHNYSNIFNLKMI